VETLAVGFRYSAFEVFELRVLLVCVLWVEAVRLRALGAIPVAVLEDGLNVFLVKNVVAPAISCAVPRYWAIAELGEIAKFGT
jgi:hypothetical protein